MNFNNLSRRQFLQLTALAGSALALTACPAAAPADGSGGGETQAEGGQAAPAAEVAILSYWTAWPQLDPAIAKFLETEEWKAHMGEVTLEYKGSVNDEAMLTA